MIMSIVRPLVLALIRFNIHLRAIHVPGVNNVICDNISRLRISANDLVDLGMDEKPTIIPAYLQPGTHYSG